MTPEAFDKRHTYPVPYPRTPSRVEVRATHYDMMRWFDDMTAEAEHHHAAETARRHDATPTTKRATVPKENTWRSK